MNAVADSVVKGGDGTVAGIARRIVEPLCDETAKFLKPAPITPHDRLHLSLDDGGDFFIAKAYAKFVPAVDPKIAKVLGMIERGELSDDGAKATIEALARVTIPADKTFVEWATEMDLERQRKASIVDASHAARQGWAVNVPERKDIGNGRWRLAATDVTALVINATWSQERIDFADAQTSASYEFLLTRFLKQTITSQQRALFKIRGEVPELPGDWLEHPTKPLAAYQKVGTIGMLEQDGCGLFMEQGTGKTPTAIACIMLEAARFAAENASRPKKQKRQLYRVLVVCPKNVRNNWANELHEFATLPGKITVLRGGALKRQKLMVETILADDDDSLYGICVCSYEAVSRSWDQIRMIPWHKVIADESHYMKSVRRNRGQAMLQLRDIAESRVCLTGTPVTNTLLDLYMQLEFMAPGMSGFSAWKPFKDFYAVFEKEGNSQFEKLTGYQNLPFLQERLARVAFMITKKEAMPDLPEKMYDTRYFDMTKTQREYYIKLQEQLALQIDAGLPGGKALTAQHILVKLLRLAQIMGGFVCWDDTMDPDTGDVVESAGIEYLDPNPLIEAFVEYVKETEDTEKVIAWACFVPFIKKLSERLTLEGIPHGVYMGATKDEDRDALVDRFNKSHARDCKVFIGNPAAGGTGINVRGYDPDTEGTPADHGCNVTRVAYLLQNWSMVYRQQSEDRCHRRGTRVNVQYTTFLCAGTILETIHERLTVKKVNALTIQDVREIMKAVLETVPEDDDD